MGRNMSVLSRASEAATMPNQHLLAMDPHLWPHDMVGQEGQPVRVFVVDDDCHARRVIAQGLMADSRTLLVGQAANLREARKNIRQQEFDVLIVDLNLGDGEGLELLEFTRNLYPSVLSIVVSVTERDDKVLQAFERGAVGYLLKNSWFDDYPQAVLQVANGGASITPVLARKLLSHLGKAPAKFSLSEEPLPDEQLSARECEILKMIACGYTGPEVASFLKISALTVNTHIKNIYRKLQTHTRAQAVRAASLKGWL